MNIVDFILTRIAEDEALADAAADHLHLERTLPGTQADAITQFFIRWNPWRVMTLCVIRRQSVWAHRPIEDELGGKVCATCDHRRGASTWPCRGLELLATEWVDHPDFRAEWTVKPRRRHLMAV